jgi:hypothetical protein
MSDAVYADDQTRRGGAPNPPAAGIATFDISADAHADLLLRVGSVLNLLNVTPRAFNLESDAGLATVHAFVDCPPHQAELIARKLRQLTAVRDVALKYDESTSRD